MARSKAWVLAGAVLVATAIAIAAAPAQVSHGVVKRLSAVSAEPESDEQIVKDFLNRKQKAEKAQRSILLNVRKSLDLKRAEFEAARKKFDEARSRYAEIVGPLPKQGVMNPEDPRLPYEFEIQRAGPESAGGDPARYRRPLPGQEPAGHP